MKCVDCGKPVSNWPSWLERSNILVRCDKCSNALPTASNAPRRQDDAAPTAASEAPAA
jgi:hypothetical protein